MEPGSHYFNQVELLVRILPLVARQDCFALKGGTAINLFVRDLPRLSVDIDLTYLPVHLRDAALPEMDAALRVLQSELEKQLPGMRVTGAVLAGARYYHKIVAQLDVIQVKIEVSPVMRGVVEPPVLMETSAQTRQTFGYVKVPVVAFNDLYVGKLCAALSRQHPRDLFDVAILLRNEGLTDALLEVFLVYLACGNKPIAEMLAPIEYDLDRYFVDEFAGMTREPVSVAMLHQSRQQLITELNRRLTDIHKQFLLSLKRGEPEWGLLNRPGIEQLPAIQWKLHNIRNMSRQKHQAALARLEKVLYS